MNDIVPVEANHHIQPATPAKPSLFDMEPDNVVAYAAKLATALKKVIDDQKLYSDIKGKKHVKVEGWTTLGVMLGILPVEEWVKEHEDGAYEAKVNLIRQRDGQIVGSATSYCGMDEGRWKGAEKYARRSMAVTRATGKAFRLGFSWILSMAGYEPTPSEEMPYIDATPEKYEGTEAQKRLLFKHAKEQGIDAKDVESLKAISKECHGLEMSLIPAAVKEWCEDRRKASATPNTAG